MVHPLQWLLSPSSCSFSSLALHLFLSLMSFAPSILLILPLCSNWHKFLLLAVQRTLTGTAFMILPISSLISLQHRSYYSSMVLKLECNQELPESLTEIQVSGLHLPQSALSSLGGEPHFENHYSLDSTITSLSLYISSLFRKGGGQLSYFAPDWAISEKWDFQC